MDTIDPPPPASSPARCPAPPRLRRAGLRRAAVALRPRCRAFRRAAGRARRPERQTAARHRPGRAPTRAAAAGARRLPRRRSQAAAGAQILGVRGATRLALHATGLRSLTADHADSVTLTGLTLDGGSQTLPARPRRWCISTTCEGLAHRRLRQSCGAGGNGIALAAMRRRSDAAPPSPARADNALFCNDSRGLIIAGNTIRKSGNGGIQVWQSDKRHDGSADRRQHASRTPRARAGGTGQNGNAINMFRAGNVIVRGNHIRNARVLRDPRQFDVRHPDHRQQLHRARRGGDLFRVRLRGLR